MQLTAGGGGAGHADEQLTGNAGHEAVQFTIGGGGGGGAGQDAVQLTTGGGVAGQDAVQLTAGGGVAGHAEQLFVHERFPYVLFTLIVTVRHRGPRQSVRFVTDGQATQAGSA